MKVAGSNKRMVRKLGKELIASIDCGGTYIKAALVDRNGNINSRKKLSTEAEKGMNAVAKNIASAVRAFEEKNQIAGVALGMAGAIEFKSGVLLQAPNFTGSENFPLKAMLQRELSLPVFIENDANVYALGEKWLGAGKPFNSFLCLTIGTGLGGGIILNSKLWRGIDGTAGEFGHITIYPDGFKCKCGNRGCLEEYVSARAISRMVGKALKRRRKTSLRREKLENITPQCVCEAALEGDKLSIEIWSEFGRILGIGLASLVNIFNAEAIIIGGGIASAFDFFKEDAVAEMKKRAFKLPADRIKLLKAKLGDDAGILGAACLAWNSLE